MPVTCEKGEGLGAGAKIGGGEVACALEGEIGGRVGESCFVLSILMFI